MKEEVTLEGLMKFMSEKLAAKSDLEDFATKSDLEGLATKEDVSKLQETLNEHTRDLNTIKNDVKTNLEKRMKLEVRVTNIERHVGLPTPDQSLV